MSSGEAFEWYIHRGDRPVGPVTSHELAMLAVGGHVGGKDVVWCHGLAEWVPLGRALGVAETAEAEFQHIPDPSNRSASAQPRTPSLRQLYLDRLPVRAGQNVPPPAPRDAARHPVMAPPASVVAPAARAPTRAPLPMRPVAEAAPPPPPPVSWQPRPAPVDDRAQRTPLRTTAIARYEAPVALRGSSEQPAFDTDAPGNGLASWATPQAPVATTGGGMRDAIANALITVMEKHGIRTVEDLAGNKSLESLASGTFDTLPWTIRTTIAMTVGRQPCEKRLIDLMLAARARWLADTARNTDLRQLVRDIILSNRIEEWLSGAYSSVVGGIGGVKDSLVSTLSKGLGGDVAPQAGGVAPPPPLAISSAGQGGTFPR